MSGAAVDSHDEIQIGKQRRDVIETGLEMRRGIDHLDALRAPLLDRSRSPRRQREPGDAWYRQKRLQLVDRHGAPGVTNVLRIAVPHQPDFWPTIHRRLCDA